MEDQNHPELHHKKIKWKEYFLEFLMIFLAVTLSFFAEGLRERLSENKQEKEIMETMTKDLAADTIAINESIGYNEDFIKTSDSLIMLLGKPQLDQNEMRQIYALGLHNMSSENVTFNRIGISELTSDGGVRFIRNKKILKLITQYDHNTNAIEDQGKVVEDFGLKIIDQANSFFDFRDFSKTGGVESGLKRENYTGQYHFLRNDPLEIRQFSNRIYMRVGIIAMYNNMLENQKEEAAKLLAEIKSVYHIKE